MILECALYFLLLTISIVVSSLVAVKVINYNKSKKMKAAEDHNVSIEIVKVVGPRKELVLSNKQLQYPPNEIWKGPLVTRGHWMEAKKEFWRYAVEEADVDGTVAIKLEGWQHFRTHHHRLFEYGLVFHTNINWDGWTIPLNVVATHNMISIEDMPRVLEVGMGNAFVVSLKVFNTYRDHALEPIEDGDEVVTVGQRLLYHVLVDRDSVGEDFTIGQFSGWPASMILDLVCNRVPGARFNTFTPEESGLVEVERREEPKLRDGEELLQEEDRKEVDEDGGAAEVEPEPLKEEVRSALSNFAFEFPDVGGSPPLAASEPKRYNEMSQNTKRRKRKRKFGKRSRKTRVKRPSSPLQLTTEQERGIIRLLVLGVEPNASEEWIAYNQDYVMNIRGVPEERPGPYVYGSGPGGWNLNLSDRQEGAGARARTPSSSVLSPRAELSQNLSSIAGSDTPCHKKMRRDTEVSSEASVIMSPFLSMKSSGGRVISISSGSSVNDDKGSGEEDERRVRVNLGDLLGSGRIIWPDNGIVANIQVEVLEDQDEDGDKAGVQDVAMSEEV